jgi:maltose alpha-D-glucosyltransferase/alpha-amylase
VETAARSASLWYKDAVIYQLHVKAFSDGTGDGTGDFAGLIEKLPYIAELGASAVWLLPFYPSPLRDDGYDIADYKGVHPLYGTLRDARKFIKAAHRVGLRVITELVVNHTSDQHPWFARARKAPRGSSARNWYVWSDSPDRYSGTRIIFTDTETSNWTWDPVAKQFYWHRFFSHQPDLNFDHPPVFEAIVDVMRFWFDLGVDGMRLDAVPYLCEREGTNNENLPETHAVLKRLRDVLDTEYPDRFLLAEANQWPEDVRAYFGDGDECHMAFHFPLMPRMFISIAEEDRYPIVDIMRQTPPIPENCQWAMFLRNHDELTLEMVTDRERAFMYRTFAPDARARVNVGIRRRLAPLMENDRRRIELMTSLLLSMPGTPIVYYGDEIGMGDNIYLGDRDGVRTPMQWSGDRNGGFSTADAQRLFLPAIMDPVYGYPAVNVEAQQRSPSSLLNWLKRLIAVRQAHRVFGRGTQTFLFPENRKIVAYVREYEDEAVLCVANLARTPQAVSLDLSRFAGRIPVEMIGWSPFPRIGPEAYVLTLPGHAFFWFLLLERVPERVEMAGPAPLPMPEFTTLVLPGGWRGLVRGTVRTLLETEIAPPYLRAVHALPAALEPAPMQLVDLIPLSSDDVPPLIALFTAPVRSQELASVLPLAILEESPGEGAIARVRTGSHEALLVDGASDDRLWLALLQALRTNGRFAGDHGTLVAEASWNLADLALAEGESLRRTTGHGRHLSAILGETVLITLFRRTHRGENAEIEIGRLLEEAHFPHSPPLLGTFVYEPAGGATAEDRIGAGIAHRYVLNQGDGWTVTRTFLERFLERRRATPLAETATSVSGENETGVYFRRAEELGNRLASLHLALAAGPAPAFGRIAIDDAMRAHWTEATVARAQFVFERLRTARASDIVADRVRDLLARGDELVAAVRSCGPFDLGVAIRIHGDFHLARILVTEADLLIVDAGAGDEMRPAGERRRFESPLRDLARMLRSFDAAAAAALRTLAPDRTEDPERFSADLAAWSRSAGEALVRGYARSVNGTELALRDPGDLATRLRALRLHDAIEALAIAVAEGSSALAFYIDHLLAT